MKKGILIVLGILALALAGFFWLMREPELDLDETSIVAHTLALQVPLKETVEERAKFKQEFVVIEGFQLRDVYEKWIDVIGANGIIQVASLVKPTAHDEGHDLGKLIYTRTQDISSALLTCDDAFFSGCMHGVLMEAFTSGQVQTDSELGIWDPGSHVEFEDVRAKANEMCSDARFSPADGEYSAGDCAHGVGHAVLFLSDYDIDAALILCDAFDTVPMRTFCASGVYMEFVENGMDDSAPEHPLSLFPCMDHEYPAMCFRFRLVLYAIHHYNDADLTMQDFRDVCAALEGKHRLGCFSGYGIAHEQLVAKGTLTIAQICSLESEDAQRVCIESLAEKFAKTSPDLAALQCLHFEDDWRQDICLSAVRGGYYNLEKDFSYYPR